MPNSLRPLRRLSPRSRTLLLSALLAASVGLLPALGLPLERTESATFPLIALAGLFAVCGRLTFDIEWRDEVQRFTLTDAPLVIGLFLLPPHQMILARLAGEVVVTLFESRRPVLKHLYNLSVLLAECTTALVIFHVLFGAPDSRTPLGWVAAVAAVTAMDILSLLAASRVIQWHGGEVVLRDSLPIGGAAAVANGSLGVIATLLSQQHAAAVLLLVTTTGVLFGASRAYSNLRQRYGSLQVLHDFSRAIGGALRPEDVVESMLGYARQLLHANVASLVVFDQGDQRGFSATLRGDGPLAQSSVAEGETLRSSAAAGECVLAPRGDHGTLAAYLDAIGAHDGICAPLALGDGMIGAFVVADRRTDVKTFDDEDARVFQTLANHATMALEKGRLIEKLRAEAARREYQAMHDPLTGLPNRAQFLLTAEQMIDAAGDRGDAVAVLLMDLDEFKDINDTLGHHMGDLLLQEIGDRLRRCSRRDDVAARLGGDEFALVVECADADAAVLVARRVLKAVQEPVDLSQLHLDVRASIGIAVWPHDGGDVASLLQRADVAMYAAKAAKTGVECYRAEVDHNTPRRLTLAAELRRALADGQLAVHYQPKADLLSGRITGAEALVRWFHPELGFIPPDEFIPVAEQTGLIGPLTTFVLGQALAQCRDWQNAGLDVGVAVNIAARSVADPGFAPLVESMLERARVSGTRLTLEITESSIMSDTHQSIDTLRELAALGVRLSVDDFGTGYSSLSYLQRLPVHELKVDRSFVFNVGVDESDRAIVRSIIQLGHSLGLAVVAEGVENQLAWDRLLEMDCDIAQGYFLSRPLAAPDLTEWLMRTAARSVMPERPLHERPELAVVRAVGE